MFTCSMLAFRRVIEAHPPKRPKKVKGLLSREYKLPEIVIDGLISRFIVIIPGEEKCAVSVIQHFSGLTHGLYVQGHSNCGDGD